jgi:hypothetical protein
MGEPIDDDDELAPPAVYRVDRAEPGTQCVSELHPGRGADVTTYRGKEKVLSYCLPCWGSVAVTLKRRGHTLDYTDTADALWDRPGVG